MVFLAKNIGGTLKNEPDDESLRGAWLAPSEIPTLRLRDEEGIDWIGAVETRRGDGAACAGLAGWRPFDATDPSVATVYHVYDDQRMQRVRVPDAQSIENRLRVTGPFEALDRRVHRQLDFVRQRLRTNEGITATVPPGDSQALIRPIFDSAVLYLSV